MLPADDGESETNTTSSSVGDSQDQGDNTTASNSPAAFRIYAELLDDGGSIPGQPSWSNRVSSGEPFQEMPPRAFEYFVDLNQNSPGTVRPQPQAFPPVSFVPAASPLGPCDLAPGHYNCPVPGCPDRFGQLGRAQGYFWANLCSHISVAHGGIPAVDAARLEVRRRVMSLRCLPGNEIDAVPRPGNGTDRSQLHSASWDLASDLEELRGWERSRRAHVSQMHADVRMGGISVGVEEEPVPQWRQSPEAAGSPKTDKKGKSKEVISRTGSVVSQRNRAIYDERRLCRTESTKTSD